MSGRPTDPWEWTMEEARAALDTGEISAAELTEAVLARVRAVDGRIRAYLTVDEEGARAGAKQADARLARGEAAPCTGLPVAIKDLICTKGLRTTAGSRMLENFVPPYDATVVGKLRQQDAVIIGKTNLDEYAMGSSCENSGFFPTRNPWDPERVPGGSSGGSAAALAAHEAIGALGTDTGGSIRQPAAFCGVVGLKPTYGRVSRYGAIAMASSFDQIGPMTKTVRDAAVLLGAIAGPCPMDSTTLPAEVPCYLEGIEDGAAGTRLGVVREYQERGMAPGIQAALESAAATYRRLGAEIVEVSLPASEYVLATYYVIVPCEVSSNLARYDGLRYGRPVAGDSMWDSYRKTRGKKLGPEVKRRIILGAYALSHGYYEAYYLRAQKLRTRISREFDRAFESCAALLLPATPTAAFRLGENLDDPLKMYLSDLYTLSASLAGLPGVALPCGTDQGLPLGMQLIGPALSEPRLLRLARAFERETAFDLRSRKKAA